MKKIFLLALIAVSFNSFAQDPFELIEKVEPQEGKVIIPYTKYKLKSNNLTLIIHEDHSDPIVHVEVGYHVGSARESVRNSGFAHFFEHMMFQGSKNVGDEEHFEIISEAGGTNNAYTSFDKTVYHQSAPSNLAETMLWLEADRMGTHLEGFTQEKFENQRDAVKNEKRQRYDNQPYGMLQEEMFKALYSGHPYEWTPIGFVDDLDAASFDDLRNFFLRWYGPNNATVIVAGDVNPEDVKTWVNKYFSTIKQCPEVKNMYPKKPALTRNFYVNLKDNIFAPLTSVVFPTVPEYHKDEAALDILSQIIGGGNNSLLYKNLVKTEDALQAGAYQQTLELSGFMAIQVLTRPEMAGGIKYKDLTDKIEASLAEFEERGVTEEDFQVIKSLVLKSSYGELASISSKADRLGHYAMMKGNGYNLQDEIDRYNAVTKEDVMRVYTKYIKNKKAVYLRIEREAPKQGDDDASKSVNPYALVEKTTHPQYKGLSYEAPKDDFDRGVRPTVERAKPITVPTYYNETFANGLELIGSESKESPLVYVYLEIEGGHLLEANKKISTGTASLTADLMGEGTERLTTEEFSRELDKLGARMSFNAGTSSTSVFVSCLSENTDATFALLEEALMKPRFDPADFKRIKKARIDGLRTQKSNPSIMASKTWNQIVYAGTIMEEYSSGNFKSLSKIGLDDVKSFYNKYYSPNVSTLVVSGDISMAEAKSKLSFLQKWENKNVEVPALPELKTPSKTTVYLVDKPYAAQSTVLVGHPSRKYDYNGDYFKSTVANYSLGGAFNSRINLNLREDKGYTYGARSGFSGGKEYGVFRFSSEIKKEKTDSAIIELMKEITNYKKDGITAEELEFTKSSITLSEALNYETPSQKLNFLSRIAEYDLPSNYTVEQAEMINSMTIADVNSAIESSLQPDNMVIIVVGHAYKIREGLNKLGYGKVVEINPNQL